MSSPATTAGRNGWGTRRSQQVLRVARRPTFLAVAAVAALIGTGLVTQPKHASTRAEFASGTAWLPSDVPGELTLLDGSTGMISDQLDSSALAGVKPGDQLDVVQDGPGAYVLDGQQGVVARVDGATHLVTAASSVVEAHASDASLYVGKQAVYVVDPAKKQVSALDPADLRSTGQPVAVSAVAAVVDSRGRLWVVDGATHRIVELDGANVHRTSFQVTEGHRVALVSVSGHPALVDYEASPPSVEMVDRGSLGQVGCLGTTPHDGSAVSAGSTSNLLWTASGMTGTVHGADLADGRCTAAVSVSSRAGSYSPPVEADGEVFVANESTGQVAIVDPATSRLVGQPVQAVTPGSHFDLFVKDGFVFFNDPDSPQAGVIRPDGTVLHVDKYTSRTPKTVRVPNPAATNRGRPQKDANAQTNGAGGQVFPMPVPGSRAASTSSTGRISGLQVTTSTLRPAFVGHPYSATLSASGGTRPYTWFVSGLPPGFELDASTGTISGTASRPDHYSVNVTVSDFTGASAGLALGLDVYVLSTLPPQVTALSPHSGSARGGTLVTVTGLHLAGETSVRFGGSAAVVYSVSDSTLEVTAPPGTAGSTVDVTVSTPAGVSDRQASDRYTYMPPGRPVVTGLSQQEGLATGHELVVISGSGFFGATKVDFGQVEAASFQVVSDAVLSVLTPSSVSGTVDVTVTSVRGRSSTTLADQYTFVPGLADAKQPDSTDFVDTSLNPGRIAVDARGDIFVSIPTTTGRYSNEVLRKRPSDTKFTVFAGNGQAGSSNGAVGSAEFDDPIGLAVDSHGNVYVADEKNQRIRKIDTSTNTVSTVVGTGSCPNAISKKEWGKSCIPAPSGLAFAPGSDDVLYFSSRYQNAVFRISDLNTDSPKVSLYAGKAVSNGHTGGVPVGDGGPAVEATLDNPEGLALNPAGDLFIADWGDNRVREVTPPSEGQIINTVAGGGGSEVPVLPQLATSVRLRGPNDVAVDPFGNVYVSEDTKHAEVDLLTTSGYIYSVVAGESGGKALLEANAPRTDAERTTLMDLGGIAFVPSTTVDAAAGGTLYVWDPKSGDVKIFT